MSSLSPKIIHEFAPTGRLRTTINLGNTVLAQRDPTTGALGGVSVALARELARRLRIKADLHPFASSDITCPA